MIARLKNLLLTEGVSPEMELESRKGGAGPVGSYLILENSTVNFRINRKSRLRLVREDGEYSLIFQNTRIPVRVPERPRFYDEKIGDLPMWMIARRHGRDVLASTVLQRCHLKDLGEGCRFCGIELSLKAGETVEMKTPEMLAETARVAKEYGDASHVTLTTGKFRDEREEIRVMSEAASRIKESSGMPVHVQITPPEEIGLLEELECDTLGIHIESFDPEVLRKFAPGKFEMRDRLIKSLERASELFGESQVSTFIILGLGEDVGMTLEGCREILQLGIIPYPVPFRPIRGTEMESHPVPSPEYTEKIFRSIAELMKDYGVNPRRNLAGCVRCGGCSAIEEYLAEV